MRCVSRAAAVSAAGVVGLLTGCSGAEAAPDGTAPPDGGTVPVTAAPGRSAPASAGSAPADGGGTSTPVDAAAPAGTADVHVYNTHGDERGYNDQRPQHLVASEFTGFSDLEWRSWDAESATGTGDLSGMWCLPGCQDDPYPVTVVLEEPREGADATMYFSRYDIIEAEGLTEAEIEEIERNDRSTLYYPRP